MNIETLSLQELKHLRSCITTQINKIKYTDRARKIAEFIGIPNVTYSKYKDTYDGYVIHTVEVDGHTLELLVGLGDFSSDDIDVITNNCTKSLALRILNYFSNLYSYDFSGWVTND